MKYNSKNMKKGVSLALTAMMMLPTTTATFVEKVSPTLNGTNKTVKTENTPYNVLNEKVLSNPISTAKPAKDAMNVYTSFTMSVNSNAGDGSIQNPYNRFEDAIAQVADGGTIYIKPDKGAFLNDVGNNLPFLIDKNITIKPIDGASNAHLSVRSAGIILGANVKFENITLDFANKHHDSIFANGHTLDLINVTRSNSAREIDLFAGGLYELDGTQVHPSGSNGVINIETNDNFGGGALMSKFGNIYAGSMNGTFNGNAEINVSSKGSYKKLNINAIKASGALEAKTGDLFEFEEPLPPTEKPDLFPMIGNVTVNLQNYQISVDGTTGSEAKTSVSTSTVYPTELELKNVNRLTVDNGHIKVVNQNFDINLIQNVAIGSGATLDLTKAGKDFTVDNYSGDGIVVLSKDGKLNISNQMNGSIELQTEGAFNGKSGLVEQNHVYIITPNDNAVISFTPHDTQSHLELAGNKTDTLVEWTIIEHEEPTNSVEINELTIENANHTKTYDEVNEMGFGEVKIPFKASTNASDDDWVDLNEYSFDITVNGKQAVYREDENGIGVHYFVEDLGLAMYFTSETFFDEHELLVMGYTVDGNQVAIETGEYEINVSHKKKDGTTTGFTSNLTVTNSEVEPPVEDIKPEVNPEVKPDVTNGIENLKDLNKELQEKVDSLIAMSTVDKQELTLSIIGDNNDLSHVSYIEVTEEGIFVTVDGKKLKFGVSLEGLELDLDNARAVRINRSRNSIVRHSAVPHKNTNDGLKITSNNLENILITSKISEPFVDVDDMDWFKQDVEEAYNYGFTTGTTATTYSPYSDINRAQFAVMIARALEMKAANESSDLKDVNGIKMKYKRYTKLVS